MNFEKLTIRGREFGDNSITQEVNKEQGKLGILNLNVNSRDYMI